MANPIRITRDEGNGQWYANSQPVTREDIVGMVNRFHNTGQVITYDVAGRQFGDLSTADPQVVNDALYKYPPNPGGGGGQTPQAYTPSGGGGQPAGLPGGTTPPSSGPGYGRGDLPAPDPNDPIFQATDPTTGKVVGIDWPAYYKAYDQWQQLTQQGGYGPGGKNAPTQSSSQSSSTSITGMPTNVDFINSAVQAVQQSIASGRLRADEAVAEFNKRMDAFKEAGTRFEGIQQYTIPRGAQYIPGYEPGGLGSQVGLQPVAASPVNYNPFQIAAGLVANSPEIPQGGTPSADEILAQAMSYLGTGSPYSGISTTSSSSQSGPVGG